MDKSKEKRGINTFFDKVFVSRRTCHRESSALSPTNLSIPPLGGSLCDGRPQWQLSAWLLSQVSDIWITCYCCNRPHKINGRVGEMTYRRPVQVPVFPRGVAGQCMEKQCLSSVKLCKWHAFKAPTHTHTRIQTHSPFECRFDMPLVSKMGS